MLENSPNINTTIHMILKINFVQKRSNILLPIFHRVYSEGIKSSLIRLWVLKMYNGMWDLLLPHISNPNRLLILKYLFK